MAEFPDIASYGVDTVASQLIADLQSIIDAAKLSAGGDHTRLVSIDAAGILSINSPAHTVGTYTGAPTDNLDNIIGTVRDGMRIVLWPHDPTGQVVTLRHNQGGSGTLILAQGADYVLDNARKYIELQYRTSGWYEIGRSIEETPSAPGQLYATASGALVVPTGITSMFVTAIGGGGGGGGGADSALAGNGSDGSAGSATIFDSINLAGGAAGKGAIQVQGGGPAQVGGAAGQSASGAIGGFGGECSGTFLSNRGQGGRGGAGGTGVTNGGGGGASGGLGAMSQLRKKLTVTPAATINYTVGAGGAGGSGGGVDGSLGLAGTAGAILVEW